MKSAQKSAAARRGPAGRRLDELLVVPQSGGWVAKRAGETRATRVYVTQAEAVDAAREMLRTTGGEVRVQSRNGRWRASFTLGRNAMAKISAVEGVRLTSQMQSEFREMDRRGLSAEARKRMIVRKYGRESA